MLVTLGLDASGMKRGAAEASSAQEKIQRDADKSAAAFKKEQEASAAAFDAMQDKAVAAGKITVAEADKRSKAFSKQQAGDAATFKKLQKEQTDSVMKKAKEEDKAGKSQEVIAKKAADSLSKIRNEILGVATAFLGAAGLKSLGEHLISVDTALARDSETLDISTDKLKAWQEAGIQLGGTAEDISSAFKTVNSIQQDLQLGNIERLHDLMVGLRGTGFSLNVEKLQSDTTSTVDKFKELSDAAKAMEPKRAQTVFGQMGFNDSQIRILRQGGPALQQLANDMAKLHPDIAKASEESRRLTAEWALLKSKAEGVGESILVKVLPALIKALDALSLLLDYAAKHVPETAILIGALSASMAVMGAMSFIKLIAGIGSVGAAVEGVTATVSGVGGLASAFSGLWAVGGPILGMLGALGLVTTAMAKLLDMISHKPNLDVGGRATVGGYNNPTPTGHEGMKWGRGGWVPDPDYKKPTTNKVEDHTGMKLGARGQGWIKDPSYIAPTTKPQLNQQSKTAVTDTPQEIVAAAQASQAKYGIPAEVTIAQWKLESGGGKRMPVGSNNPFGIKAKAGQPFVESETKEFIDGEMQTVKQKFAKFDSLEDAFDAHAKLLATGAAYADARKQKGDPQAFADALTGTYATDPQYGQKLKSLMNQGIKPTATTPVDPSIMRAIAPGAPIDKSLNVGAQSAVANSQSTTNNNQATNSQHVENHIGSMNINAPQAKTNSDIADAMFGRLQSYSFASMSNLGLA